MAIAEKELVVKARAAAADQAKSIKPGQILAVTAEELGATTEGSQVELTQDQREGAQMWTENYKAILTRQAEQYVQRMNTARADGTQGIGKPTVGPYVAWDIVSISPIQLTGSPMLYRPNKIVASGDLVLLEAIMWTNPIPDVPNGFAVPANLQLGLRHFRVSFDRLDLTTATAAPSIIVSGAFGPVVPPLILFNVFFVAPPVASPHLVEVNVTADITDLAQPYAAFATHHFDVDSEPEWFTGFPPSIPPQLQHDIPLRYMVYPQ
jgi:hypothetical protein